VDVLDEDRVDVDELDELSDDVLLLDELDRVDVLELLDVSSQCRMRSLPDSCLPDTIASELVEFHRHNLGATRFRVVVNGSQRGPARVQAEDLQAA
jgi:hypothetical protein